MPLTAFPHYLFDPAAELWGLRQVEERFLETWLKRHSYSDDRRLHHYTSLAGLQGILDERNLRLSHITSFNDPQEIEYGKAIVMAVLTELLRKEENQDVRDFLSGIPPFVQSFGRSMHHAFVTCFCEDGNLLSQWRGYAEQGLGYSMGFDFSDNTLATQYASSQEDLASAKPPYLRKVIYDQNDQRQLVEQFLNDSMNAVRSHLGRVHSFEVGVAGAIALQAVNILLELMLCFKHPAFSEEKEWRLFRVTSDTLEVDGVRFRVSREHLVPYRPTFVFNTSEKGAPEFPLRSITAGPGLEPGRARAAVLLLLQSTAQNSSQIALVPHQVQFHEAGFALRSRALS